MIQLPSFSRRRAVLTVLASGASSLGLFSGSARAQAFPNRPIKLLVPVAAGGGTDLIARVVADALSRTMGQTWVVDNQAGAGGQIASQATARAAADGYSLMLGYVSTHGTLPAVRKLPYDTQKDFTYIGMIGGAPNVLVSNAVRGPQTFQQFLQDVRANPGRDSFGSAGAGTITHLVFERLKVATNTSIVHVPYKGVAPVMTDLLANQIQYAMPGLAGALNYIRSGKATALAVTGPRRHPLLPDVPTLKELGVPDFEAVQWVGIMGPAGIPADVGQKLTASLNEVLKQKELAEKLTSEGIEVMPMSVEAFRSYVAADSVRWREVVKKSDIKES
ncbi:Bug family tripartite tricarboxylate transporter substrate binding protein [Hydrogenophaga sp. BPS33]|uniref:Bug family tripartite tricarboxylate transporter substrate binding protein n=1 Tax=Hydrogenophaga sp. BPS33 TaxID=2651974 RepID=UPI00132035FA|nr:tripartite tricarboxylate transporter substrate binding protein [Hydrogenophaga sp. BPS33]QHE85464.1 tripartite tricarboxylate transporter substrate binding protein [Hydrogenophaga sp. BPS33]